MFIKSKNHMPDSRRAIEARQNDRSHTLAYRIGYGVGEGMSVGGHLAMIFGVVATVATGINTAVLSASPKPILTALGATVAGLGFRVAGTLVRFRRIEPIFPSTAAVVFSALATLAGSYGIGKALSESRFPPEQSQVSAPAGETQIPRDNIIAPLPR